MANSVTLEPATVQTAGVVDTKLTASAEVADAVKVTGPAFRDVSAGCVKVIVCAPGLTVKPCETLTAGAKVPLPAWLAVMAQFPAATTVTVVFATVQIAGVMEVKLTGKPELAVAPIVNGVAPKLTPVRAPKAIVWAWGTMMVVTSLADAANEPPPERAT